MSDSGPTQGGETVAAAGRTRWRSVAAGVCVVLAALLTVPAGIAFWGQRTLNDGQRYLDTVGPLVDSPQVQDAIATKVIDAIEKQVDVEAILNDVFAGVITDRPRLQKLVGPLAGAVNGLIEREVRAFVASDAFADIWVRVNTRAQQALVRVLKGDTSRRGLGAGRPGRAGRLRRHRPGQAAAGRPRPHGRGERPDPRHGQADRAAGRAAAEAGADDLRVREPGGQVADRRRRAALPGRVPARPPPAADDGDHRSGAGGERAAGGVCCLSVGRQLFIDELAGTEFGPASPCSTTRCWPTSNAAGRCCSGSA